MQCQYIRPPAGLHEEREGDAHRLIALVNPFIIAMSVNANQLSTVRMQM